MICPNCDSPDLVRLALLHERGTLNTTNRSVVVAGNTTAYVTTSGVTQTRSAVRATPPEEKSTLGWQILWLIYVPFPVLIGLPLLLSPGLRLAVIPVYAFAAALHLFVSKNLRRIKNYNATTYQQLLAEWKRLFQCNKCGLIAEPISSASTTAPRTIRNVTERELEG